MSLKPSDNVNVFNERWFCNSATNQALCFFTEQRNINEMNKQEPRYCGQKTVFHTRKNYNENSA